MGNAEGCICVRGVSSGSEDGDAGDASKALSGKSLLRKAIDDGKMRSNEETHVIGMDRIETILVEKGLEKQRRQFLVLLEVEKNKRTTSAPEPGRKKGESQEEDSSKKAAYTADDVKAAIGALKMEKSKMGNNSTTNSRGSAMRTDQEWLYDAGYGCEGDEGNRMIGDGQL